MNAKAIDILGRVPPLDLGAYSYVEINGMAIEIRDGELTVRARDGVIFIKPLAANTVEIRPVGWR